MRLNPVVEGYVYQGDGAFHLDSYLKISGSAGLQHASLLRFDLAGVPVDDPIYLVGARLVLYCTSLDTNEWLAIYPIIKSWDTSVTYSTATASTFIDSTIDVGFPLAIMPNVENTYDITLILRAWFGGLPNYGIRLHGDPNRYFADTMFSSSLGGGWPRLEVDYLAVP